MNALDDLLRAVLAHPDEDTPRLMYADALREKECPEEEREINHLRADCIQRSIEEGRNAGLEPVLCLFLAEAFGVEIVDSDRVGTVRMARHYFGTGSGVLKTPERYQETESGGSRVVWTFRRGFVEELKCPVWAFLRVAPKLLWHPEQRMVCSECEGQMLVCEKQNGGWPCIECEGKGFLPTPCPPTAQPIKKVKLHGALVYFWHDALGTWYDQEGTVFENWSGPCQAKEALEKRFPGVVFEYEDQVGSGP